MDAAVDGKFYNNHDLTSIFSKVIVDKLYDSPSQYLCMCCRMNLVSDPVQIMTPQFIELGLSTIDAVDKVNGLSTPVTII